MAFFSDKEKDLAQSVRGVFRFSQGLTSVDSEVIARVFFFRNSAEVTPQEFGVWIVCTCVSMGRATEDAERPLTSA